MKTWIDENIERLWLGYEKDLSRYIGLRSKNESLMALREYDRSDCYFIPIYSEGPVGFFIIGIDESCHPDCDYFIAEAYIEKEYRGKGIMSVEVGKILRTLKGTYCLDVFHENKDAKEFWDRVFKENGYVKTHFPYVEHGMDRTKSNTYFWKPL